MRYEEAINLINSVSWELRAAGLSRIKELLRILGDPQKGLIFIHVAGTNGKGSTCAMLESVLRESGYKTGLFTSPHLIRYNERIRVNGADISDDDFITLTEKVMKATEQLPESPTVFEILTAIGFLYFAEQHCDIVILEVGMGGEYDSTNVIDTPLLSVITPIGLDHCACLGSTKEEIAKAKAGIIKKHGTAVISYENRDLRSVFDRRSDETCSRAIYSEPYKGPIRTALLGEYQRSNLSLVLTVIRVLVTEYGYRITEGSLNKGLSAVTWPARFEYLMKSPDLILDGAHNPHGIRGVTDSLKAVYGSKKIIYITGMLGDKNIDGMLDILTENAKLFYTLRPESKRACEAEALSERIRQRGYECITCDNVPAAIEGALRNAAVYDVICCLGSLYLAGTIREYVRNR